MSDNVERIHAALCRGISYGTPDMDDALDALASLVETLKDVTQREAEAAGQLAEKDARMRTIVGEFDHYIKELRVELDHQNQAANQFRRMLEQAEASKVAM